MPHNKNQHFVPRCYFRPFSKDSEGRAVCLFNIDRSESRKDVPLKSQCSGSYFYGSDLRTEVELQKIENTYASVSRGVSSPGYELDEAGRNVLLQFWLIQHLRTEAAALRVTEQSAGVQRLLGPALKYPGLSHAEAIEMAMGTFKDALPLVADLKGCLIKNRSGVPFLTSDDPAILANRWHAYDVRAAGSSAGLASAGAMLMLPLSPTVLYLGYDASVYRVPASSGWATITRDEDAFAFNEQQVLNARSNIYFREWSDAASVGSQFLQHAPRRAASSYKFHFAVSHGRVGQLEKFVEVNREPRPGDSGMIAWSGVVPSVSRWPSVIGWRPEGSVHFNGTAMGYLRKETARLSPQSFPFKKLRSRS